VPTPSANPYAGNLTFGFNSGLAQYGFSYVTKGDITRIVIKTKMSSGLLPEDYDSMTSTEELNFDESGVNLPANGAWQQVSFGHFDEQAVTPGSGRTATRITVYSSSLPTWTSNRISNPADYEKLGGTSGGGSDTDGNVQPLSDGTGNT
jgi:hypothetical protein